MSESRFEMSVREFLAKPPFKYRDLDGGALELFCSALTHDSYTYEARDKPVPEEAASYERLEFLGDAILEALVCEHVYSNTELSEGGMTDFKQEYVDNEKLSERIKSYGLDIDGSLRVGKVQMKGGKKDVQTKMRADAFEALLAATYLAKGLGEARRVAFEVLGLQPRRDGAPREFLSRFYQENGFFLPI